MRIALITREYPPETAWGGIGTFYHSFAHALKSEGLDVEVFTQGLKNPSIAEDDGILIHRVVPRKWIVGKRIGGDLAGNSNLGIFAISLAAEMNKVFSARHRQLPFDIVEGHEHLGINAFINILHKSTLITVTRYHTSYYSLINRELANWPKSKIIKNLELLSIRSANYRISPSHFIDEITRLDFPDTQKADAVIPLNGKVNTSNIASVDIAREAIILFVGRMMPGHKNPDMLAKAFALLADRYPGWRVEFAGMDIRISPAETMWQRCEEILTPYKGRYKYHGVLSRDAVYDLYRKAAIVVIPSRFESFCLVAQEAMEVGCIPVVADNTSLPEVVGDAGIIFKNGSLEDLVLKLEHLIENRESLQKRSEACVRRIQEAFSSSHVIELNINFFNETINKRKY